MIGERAQIAPSEKDAQIVGKMAREMCSLRKEGQYVRMPRSPLRVGLHEKHRAFASFRLGRAIVLLIWQQHAIERGKATRGPWLLVVNIFLSVGRLIITGLHGDETRVVRKPGIVNQASRRVS